MLTVVALDLSLTVHGFSNVDIGDRLIQRHRTDRACGHLPGGICCRHERRGRHAGTGATQLIDRTDASC